MSARMRNSFELVVVANLAPICPFHIPEEHRESWAHTALDTFKRKFPSLWESCCSSMNPRHIPALIVDVILSGSQGGV